VGLPRAEAYVQVLDFKFFAARNWKRLDAFPQSFVLIIASLVLWLGNGILSDRVDAGGSFHRQSIRFQASTRRRARCRI